MSMRGLLALFKSLGLGLVLVAGAGALLLSSDLDSRTDRKAETARDAKRVLRIALVEPASIQASKEGAAGMLAGLAAGGYSDGARIRVRHFNSEGDLSVLNAIAKDVTSSNYDLILSVGTVSLQAIGNANRHATPPRTHVFGIVSDPYAVGLGIDRDNHLKHPPYMTGIGSMPAVAEIFDVLRQLRPQVRRVGLVWNPAEASSVAATTLARGVCAKLGITLVEGNAENTTSVGEVAAAVIARGVDALWISTDITVLTAADVMIAIATQADVPVFTSIPGTAEKGALFDLGADYRAVGSLAGQLAAEVLDGRSPATIPVENVMPIRLSVNVLALDGLRADWQIPDAVKQRADLVIDATGSHRKVQP